MFIPFSPKNAESAKFQRSSISASHMTTIGVMPMLFFLSLGSTIRPKEKLTPDTLHMFSGGGMFVLGTFFTDNNVTDDAILENSETWGKFRKSISVTLPRGCSPKFRPFAVTKKYQAFGLR